MSVHKWSISKILWIQIASDKLLWYTRVALLCRTFISWRWTGLLIASWFHPFVNLKLYTLKCTSYFSQEKRVWILRDSINAKICKHLHFSIVLGSFVGLLVEQSMMIVYFFIIDFISFKSNTNQIFGIHS